MRTPHRKFSSVWRGFQQWDQKVGGVRIGYVRPVQFLDHLTVIKSGFGAKEWWEWPNLRHGDLMVKMWIGKRERVQFCLFSTAVSPGAMSSCLLTRITVDDFFCISPYLVQSLLNQHTDVIRRMWNSNQRTKLDGMICPRLIGFLNDSPH